MNLTVDIGNTSIKIIIFNDTIPVFRSETSSLKPKHIEKLYVAFPIQHCIVSAVVNIPGDINKAFNKAPKFTRLNEKTPSPVRNKYKTPATLGNDRLANAIAASFLFPGKNVLVIDAGTCLKFDFVNARKEYLGGSISPGLEMRFKALKAFTGKLPLVKAGEVKSFTGRTTETSIRSGVMVGMREEMLGLIRLYRQKYNSLKIVLTGGDAFRFVSDLKLSIFAAPDLVNIGLNEIARYNSPAKK